MSEARAASPWRRLRHSLRVRLVLLFLLLALAMSVAFIGGVGKALSAGWRGATEPLFVDYADRLVDELGTPPSIARAQALAEQTTDVALAATFAPLAQALADNEATIVAELLAVQGKPVDIGGYYPPDAAKLAVTLRAALAALPGQSAAAGAAGAGPGAAAHRVSLDHQDAPVAAGVRAQRLAHGMHALRVHRVQLLGDVALGRQGQHQFLEGCVQRGVAQYVAHGLHQRLGQEVLADLAVYARQ